jgi:hypothetical protein
VPRPAENGIRGNGASMARRRRRRRTMATTIEMNTIASTAAPDAIATVLYSSTGADLLVNAANSSNGVDHSRRARLYYMTNVHSALDATATPSSRKVELTSRHARCADIRTLFPVPQRSMRDAWQRQLPRQ